ncbi:MAG: type IX secretion system membrane protein PorP/SprF [Crocinitomix sp.]|nr:type IX secretion system membrane protein PorP/SprF [Crocinitomix sp.]
MNIPENFDRWMFDYMEGNLSPTEVNAFEQFLLQNPGFEPAADAWQNSIIPIDTVVYPQQSSLERNRKFAGWFGWSAAAALVVLIGVGGYFAINATSNNTADTQFAQFSKAYNETSSNYLSENNKANDATSNNNSIVSENGNNTNETTNYTTAAQYQNQIAVTSLTNETYSGVSNGNGEEDLNGATDNLGATNSNAAEEDDFNDADYYVTVNAAMKQEQAKYKSDNHSSKYAHNPTEGHSEIDLRKKNNVNLNSFGNVTKRIYRKIERMFGYPVGLVNLRDPELLLPENSLVSSNPGFAGGMLMPRFELSYRNQWLGSEMNAQKTQFSFDNYVHQVRGGFGVSVNSATYGNGAFGDYSVDMTYSPKISLGPNAVLEPGIKVSLGVLTGNSSKLEEGMSFELDRGMLLNSSFASDNEQTDKLWYKDYGLGFVLNTKWFYAGLSADNIGRHYASVYREEGSNEPIRTSVLYSGVIGADYESANKNMSISPFIAARHFGESQEAWAGANFRINHFTIGGSYSTNNDFTAAIGMKFKNFKMIYQYDRTTTLLNNEQIGSHNLGIRFNGKTKNARFK